MKRITQLRETAGHTRAALAAHAGMHPATVGAIELGRIVPYPGQLAKIAKALGWSGEPAELLEEIAIEERLQTILDGFQDALRDCRYHDEYGKGNGLYLQVVSCEECRYWKPAHVCQIRLGLEAAEALAKEADRG